MTISLSGGREQFVRALVHGGRYASEADVIEEAFRLLEQQALIQTAEGQQPSGAPHQSQTTPLAPDELNRRLLASGLVIQLPDPTQDSDDADDLPIEILGEPLSETILRERR